MLGYDWFIATASTSQMHSYCSGLTSVSVAGTVYRHNAQLDRDQKPDYYRSCLPTTMDDADPSESLVNECICLHLPYAV